MLNKTTLELVEAYEYAERRQTDHYYYCADQRDEVGCDTCARNSDEVYVARKAMNASPAAKELHNSEERRAYRRADAIDPSVIKVISDIQAGKATVDDTGEIHYG